MTGGEEEEWNCCSLLPKKPCCDQGDRVVHIRQPPQAKLQANWQLMNDTLEPAPVQLCARDVVGANQVDVCKPVDFGRSILEIFQQQSEAPMRFPCIDFDNRDRFAQRRLYGKGVLEVTCLSTVTIATDVLFDVGIDAVCGCVMNCAFLSMRLITYGKGPILRPPTKHLRWEAISRSDAKGSATIPSRTCSSHCFFKSSVFSADSAEG